MLHLGNRDKVIHGLDCSLSICTVYLHRRPGAEFNQHWSLVMGEVRSAVAERCYGSGAAIPSLRHAVWSKPLGPLCLGHFVR